MRFAIQTSRSKFDPENLCVPTGEGVDTRQLQAAIQGAGDTGRRGRACPESFCVPAPIPTIRQRAGLLPRRAGRL